MFALYIPLWDQKWVMQISGRSFWKTIYIIYRGGGGGTINTVNLPRFSFSRPVFGEVGIIRHDSRVLNYVQTRSTHGSFINTYGLSHQIDIAALLEDHNVMNNLKFVQIRRQPVI